jgi:hypothetical protein
VRRHRVAARLRRCHTRTFRRSSIPFGSCTQFAWIVDPRDHLYEKGSNGTSFAIFAAYHYFDSMLIGSELDHSDPTARFLQRFALDVDSIDFALEKLFGALLPSSFSRA